MSKEKPRKLNLGCGWDKKTGFFNIDIAKEVKPDKVWDLKKGLPFIEDNSINYIYSSHALEHVPPSGYHFLFDEMIRVSKNKAIWEFNLPFDNIYTRTNNEHFRTYSWKSFDQYNLKGKRFYYKKVGLKQLNKKPNFFQRWFFQLFPWLKWNVYFKFRVIRNNILTAKTEFKKKIVEDRSYITHTFPLSDKRDILVARLKN